MKDTIKEEGLNFSKTTINEPESTVNVRQVLEQEINNLTLIYIKGRVILFLINY